MASNSKAKKKVKASAERHQPQMKIVTVDTCIACRTPCQRGMAYVKRMETSGTIGTGVPCILTLK